MSSSRHILEDFVRPISTCSHGADLDNILRIVQSSQYSTIAIVNEQDFPIGIVNGRSLVALIVKQWSKSFQNKTLPGTWEQIKTCPDIADNFQLDAWIEPIAILKSDLSWKQLLSYLQAGTIDARQNYLMVDADKKLLGLLDTFRLGQWLLNHHLERDRSLFPMQESTISSLDIPIFQFIEQIPVPLMLQTQTGNALYANSLWREQVEKTEIAANRQPVQSHYIDLPSWELIHNQQDLTPSCLKGNYYLSPSFANSSPQVITFESQEILDKLTTKTTSSPRELSEYDKLQLSILQLDSLSAKTKKAEWQYFKVPLKLTDSQFYSPQLPPQISLLVAINIPSTPELDSPTSNQDLELAKLNQLKDQFLASISHELKSPLTAIVGLSGLLKEEKLGQLNQRQIRYSKLIYRSGRQLMKIVSDMLELTYLATGKLKLNIEPIKIKSLCTEAYQQVLRKLEESSQFDDNPSVKPRFKLSIAKDLEIVLADEMRLRQILTYLMDNAIKFIQWKESKSSSGQKKIAISIDYWSNWIAITIADNGIGIPDQHQHLLLEQFCQLENHLDQNYDNTGLGLILAQQLAKAHGGDISFISGWGKGSKFTVLLPSSPTNISSELVSNDHSLDSLRHSLEIRYRQNHHRQKSSTNLVILIIDSVVNQINQLYWELRELGYYPIVARTATEALHKARNLKPSKIFLNPSLFEDDNPDLLSSLKSAPHTATIPLFLLVAHRAEKQNYPQADGCLTLPITQKSLLKLVPLVEQDLSRRKKYLTILHLYPESEITSNLKITHNVDLNVALHEHLSGLNHRVLEADSLEQGEVLARIWQIDAIVLDGRILLKPLAYLRSLRKSLSLSSLPLVTLDAQTTEAANQIEGLTVFPCLLPEKDSNFANLVQVIQIAAGIGTNK